MTDVEDLDATGLTAKQQEALSLLVTGHSPAQTAEQCQISVDTIYVWRCQHPIFGDLERRIVKNRLQEAIRQAQGMVPIVLANLLALVTDANVTPRDRITASRVLLDLCAIDARAVAGETDVSGDVETMFRTTADAIADLVRSQASGD